MTCIVGYVDKENLNSEGFNRVYIGGDSAGVKGLDVVQRADEKVFKKGNMIFGFTTSFRMGQIIRYCFEIPDHDPRINDDQYLCNTFVSSLIKCFKKEGYSKKRDNGEVEGGTFLLGYKGKLYKVINDFQVAKSVENFESCGCGESFAIGALDILDKSTKIHPEDKVSYALKTAEKFSGGVSRPFNIVSI